MELARQEIARDTIVLGDKVYDIALFRACEQCGRCSSACPLTGIDGFNIRRILRHIELDLIDEIVDSPLPWSCTACGRCEDACPNGIELLDIIRFLRQQSPPQWIPEGTPCVLACPVTINIPGYVRLIAEGKKNEAYALIREKVPFPGILGRVCTHPCEETCRRRDVFHQPIAICALKRYVADIADNIPAHISQVQKDTGHKVAIIGSGPAGLTAAFYLRKKGHQVTIFEAQSEPGGMMRYGIPAYRLPQEVVQKEIRQILALGIEVKTEQKLGSDFDLDQLKNDGYEAVFIAVGAQASRRIELEGADLDGVLWGVDFLRAVREGTEIAMKDHVAVIGGGNVAVDVALTALRLGAKEVTMACLEGRDEMPAHAWEIEQALEEGVKLMPSWGPSKIIGTNGKVSAIELVRCTSVFDAAGNFFPTFDPATTTTVDTDQVILAIGQAPDLTFAAAEKQLQVERGLIVVNKATQESTVPGVLAGGDVVNSPATIIEAIAAGRTAACTIDKLLGGSGDIDETFVTMPPAEPATGRREKGFADLKREEVPKVPISERRAGFAEVDRCLDDDQAIREAQRCLGCDLELAVNQKHTG